MPYGLAQEDTAEYIMSRAKEGNVSERIQLESESPDMTITVMSDSASDEEFDFFSGGFGVNVADWVAEHLESEGITDYEIFLSEIDSPNTVYWKSGYSA